MVDRKRTSKKEGKPPKFMTSEREKKRTREKSKTIRQTRTDEEVYLTG